MSGVTESATVYLILDANVLVADLSLTGTSFRTLFDSLPRVSVQLLLPELVLDETVGRYRRKLAARRDELRKTERKLNELLVTGTPDLPDLQIDEETERYRKYLEERIESVGGRICGYPSVPHDDVARRAIDRKKPFSDSGAGYRDYLIWRCVVEILADADTDVVFITEDKDFTAEGELHPELEDDLAASGIDSRPQLLESIDQFNDRFVVPHLEKLEEIQEKIQQGDFEHFNIDHWISSHEDWLLSPEDLLAYGVGVHPRFGSASLPTIIDIRNVLVDNVRALHSGDLVLSAQVEVEAEFSASFERESYERSRVVRRILESDGHFSEADIPFENIFAVNFKLTLAGDDYSVIDYEPVDINSRWSY